MTEPRYIRLAELAKMNGLTPRALADAARAGKIVTYKPQRWVVTTEEDFENYMQSARSNRAPAERPPTQDADQRFLLAQARRRSKNTRKGDTR